MPAQARELWGCGTRLCMFNMSFRLPTQLWMWIGCLPGCLAAVYNPVACLLSVQLGGPSPKVLTASLCIQILGMRHCHSTICSISFFFLFSIFLPSSTLFFLCVLSLLAAHSHSTLISARILASHFYSLSMLFVRFGTTNMVEFIFCSLFYRVLVPPPTPVSQRQCRRYVVSAN